MIEKKKGVSWRMGTNMRVCEQEMANFMTFKFLMSSKTKSGETSAAKNRMVGPVLLKTPPKIPFDLFLGPGIP